MVNIKGLMIAMLLFAQARAQVNTSDTHENTAKQNFRSVYETNEYFNEMEEAIELKYANMKVPILERMEKPQDSLFSLEDQIESLREEIRLLEFGFIHWEKNFTGPRDRDFTVEREKRVEVARAGILRLRQGIERLEAGKSIYIHQLKKEEKMLDQYDKEKEKELQKNRLERQAALVKMYRA
jgi:hypothetical protein